MKTGRPPIAPTSRLTAPVSVRFTAAEIAQIDAARGTLTRAAWLRAVAMREVGERR